MITYKAADLILVASADPLSQAIMHATNGVVSHTAGVIAVPMELAFEVLTFEALNRVKTNTLSTTLNGKTAAYLVSDQSLAPAQRNAIVEAVLTFSADDYGYADLLLQELDSLGKTTFWTDHLASLILAHCQICSFIWPKAYEMALGTAGRGWGTIKSVSITPQDLLVAAQTEPQRYAIQKIA